MLLDKTIRLFLDSIGRREEYEFYLSKFKAVDAAYFALLVPDLESLARGGEALAFDLQFLIRLGLRPALVLCGSDAAQQWRLLAPNPLFERVNSPVCTTDPERVSVFVIEHLEGLWEMIPTWGNRVHFIRAQGGFSVDYYYTQKSNSLALNAADQALATFASELLAARPGTHLSVTSPMNLLREIFTVKGAGTVFRKGSMIISPSLQALERRALLKLLEESFQKVPCTSVLDGVTNAYVDEHFRGAVLLESHSEGLYLSKFAVGPEARGEGLAQELWETVCRNHASFFWRSRIGNSVNRWYDRQADGYYTSVPWLIFWRGMAPESLPGLIEFCRTRAADFIQ